VATTLPLASIAIASTDSSPELAPSRVDHARLAAPARFGLNLATKPSSPLSSYVVS